MLPSLITSKSNIRYLSNFTGSAGFMLVTPRTKYLFTDSRYILRAKNTIQKGIKIIEDEKEWPSILKKHKITKLGIEEKNLTLSRFKKFKKISAKIKFTDISGEIDSRREKKTAEEIRFITKSQRINEKVFKEIPKLLKPRVTEVEIAYKIKELGQKFGAEDVAFNPVVAFAKNSAEPHHLPDKTRFKKGMLVLVDMGMKFKGYCSDMTRIIFTKKPSPLESKIYNLVLEAQKAMIKELKLGNSASKVDKAGRTIIEKAGYGEKYTHAGGHGLGLDIHEAPSLHESYKKRIKENSVVTIEPGIYLEGKFGIRIEDMILVKKTTKKNLTKISKKLN